MFERYTERARRVLFFARYEASQLGNLSIDTEHLLLGLVREGKGLTSRLFARANLSFDDLRRDIESRAVSRQTVPVSTEIPFTDAAKQALQSAAVEADRLLHNYIGTEHLLLGLLSDPHSVAGQILTKRGLRLAAVREDIVILLNEPPPASVEHGRASVAGVGFDVALMSADAPPGIVTRSGPDHFFAKGFTVRALLARLLKVEDRQIELPPDLDGPQRYECNLRLRQGEPSSLSDEQVIDRVSRHFGVFLTREQRPLNAYVLSAPHGQTRAMRSTPDMHGGGFGSGAIEFSTVSSEHGPPSLAVGSIHSIGPLSMSGTTMAELARSLEDLLQYPVVDETGLSERFDVEVLGHHEGVDAFLAAFQDQLGLVITRRTVDVEMVIVGRR